MKLRPTTIIRLLWVLCFSLVVILLKLALSTDRQPSPTPLLHKEDTVIYQAWRINDYTAFIHFLMMLAVFFAAGAIISIIFTLTRKNKFLPQNEHPYTVTPLQRDIDFRFPPENH